MNSFSGLRALTLSLVFAVASTAAAEEVTFHRIGTGAVGDSYFAIGGTIANAISNPPGARPCDRGGSCGVPGLIATAQSTEGSLANVDMLAANEVHSALVQADVIYWAYHGSGQLRERAPQRNLRAISNLFPSTLHIVVRAGADISEMSTLAGRRISLGEAGSGTLVTARTILDAYGLGEPQIVPQFQSPNLAAQALEQDEIDAFFQVGGVPVAAIGELALRVPLQLLPLSGTPGEDLRSFFPFFADVYVASGVYQGIPRTRTVGLGTQWITTEEQSEEMIYGITAALWHEQSRALFENGHPEGKRMSLQNALAGIAIPLHPGAERFYREQGIER